VRNSDVQGLGERARGALRAFADGALELLYPTRCVSCDLPGALVCDDCRAELP
jgi:hypothetical protein